MVQKSPLKSLGSWNRINWFWCMSERLDGSIYFLWTQGSWTWVDSTKLNQDFFNPSQSMVSWWLGFLLFTIRVPDWKGMVHHYCAGNSDMTHLTHHELPWTPYFSSNTIGQIEVTNIIQLLWGPIFVYCDGKILVVSKRGFHIIPYYSNYPSPKKTRGSKIEMLPSSKLTWQWKSTFSNREYIFKWWIFHCYVSLLEGIYFLS